ncbi:MAG: hypothetical protein ACI4TX_00675, partial [Christensenellales bacterium]
MKKISILSMLLISILCLTTGCFANTTLNTQGAISLVQTDMANIANTIRSLDNIYLEDYAINELSPLMNYNAYNNANYSNNLNNNVIATVSASPITTYNLNYSYTPKYIENVNSLDTSYLVAYIQSMQDLFLITSDITAANQLLNQLTYSIINDTINVRNNAYLLNYNMNELTEEQIAIIQEYSANINNILINIQNTSGYVNRELDTLIELRNNFYKNAETLNAKYLNVLNILENRIIQLQNIQLILERLNNQLLLMSDVNNLRNNISNYNNNNINNNDDLNDNNDINGNNNIINDTIIDDNIINNNNECHNCQICDICGNCAECELCEVCPNCQLPSTCQGNCSNLNNNAINNYANNNATNNYNSLNNNNALYNNNVYNEDLNNNGFNNNTNYNDLNNNLNNNSLNNSLFNNNDLNGNNNFNNTINNVINDNKNCHQCEICDICGNCAECELCEVCPNC